MEPDLSRLSEIRASKEALRRVMRERLRAFSVDERAEASLLICQAAAHLAAFVSSRCVALFASLPCEPDVGMLMEEAWAQGKRVALPLMIKGRAGPELDWHRVDRWDDLISRQPFHLREPDPLRCPRLAVAELDCAFVPGMAFDGFGFRLGRGGGFYDYFLGRAPASLPRFGLMFDAQQVPRLPRESHDQRLHGILTESGWRDCAALVPSP